MIGIIIEVGKVREICPVLRNNIILCIIFWVLEFNFYKIQHHKGEKKYLTLKLVFLVQFGLIRLKNFNCWLFCIYKQYFRQSVVWYDTFKDIQHTYGYISAVGCIMCSFMLEYGFYFDNRYMQNDVVEKWHNRNCAFQVHQCDSLIVPELGEFKTGLAVSQQIRPKLCIGYTKNIQSTCNITCYIGKCNIKIAWWALGFDYHVASFQGM